MRIAIATAVYYPQINGVAVFAHNLAAGLARRGNEVLVICPSQTGRSHSVMQDGVKVCYLKSLDAKIYPDQIHPVPEKKKLFYKNGFRVSIFPKQEVKRILDDFQPDVVHVQVADPVGLSVVGWARNSGVPVVTTEHNQPDVITNQLKLGIFKKPANALMRAYLIKRHGKSDFVTMPTEKAIDDLIWSRGKEFKVPLAAVSNGVDLSHFGPGKADDEVYKKYGLNSKALTVLYVGRVDPEKTVGLVVEAFVEMAKEVKNVQLVVVGDGTDKARLQKKYASDARIHFLGKITPPELYDIYKLGDVFATASKIETQGIVLIEAAASGLPLVAVNAGAVSEVCVDGENGLLCEPGNKAELSQALRTILTDDNLRERFAKKSVQIVKEHDFERTLDKFMNIYTKLLS